MSNKMDSTDMKQETTGELKPKLRFPEFQDAPEWEEKKLLDVCDINPSNEGLPESFVYIDLESVVAGRLIYNKKIYRDSAPSRAQRLLKHGDVIYQIVRPYQRNNLFCAFDDENSYVASTGYAQLRSFDVSKFLYQLVHTDTFVTKVIDKCTGSNYPAINSSDLAEITVAIPKAPEQQKIADCLSSLDDLIVAQNQKFNALKTHKKGLLQQLFPAEGESLPQFRFPEFENAPEWKKKKAGALFANRTEGGKEGLPIYSVTMNNGMIKRALLDRDVDDIAKPEGNRKVYKDDIAYNMMRMWQGASGVAVEDCMVSPAYVVLAPQDDICSDFFGYLLKLPGYLKLLISHSQGLTLDRLRLYYKDFAHILLLYPSLPEQQKIADCLSSIDELIIAQSQQLDALRIHKKGLMQQLFPSSDEPQA